jgi:hypothetical protein
MRSVRWDRDRVIESVRSDVWRYVSQASRHEDETVLEAGALLQMSPNEVRTLGRIQFITSDAVHKLLREMPALSRRLRTTAISEEERSPERVRGSIRWGATFAERAATGLPHIYVTAPARRAFQTAENEVLVSALDSISDQGKRTGWQRSASPELGTLVRSRVVSANRWLRLRSLAAVERRPLTPRVIARVRSGRAARRYATAVEVVALHRRYLKRLDRSAIKKAIEDHALVASDDAVLLELLCLFQVERALRDSGWTVTLPGLVRSGRVLLGSRGRVRLELFYQRAPKELSEGSLYRAIQRGQGFAGIGGLIPDMVLKVLGTSGKRWILIEVKGLHRSVADSARAATRDLLAYRRAFEPVLSRQALPYGIGIAWGENLHPHDGSEVMLCSPDTITESLDLALS